MTREKGLMTILHGLKVREVRGQRPGRKSLDRNAFLLVHSAIEHFIEYLLCAGPSQCTDYKTVTVTAFVFVSSNWDERDWCAQYLSHLLCS